MSHVLSPHLTGMTRRAEALTFADATRDVVAVLTASRRQPSPTRLDHGPLMKGHPAL